MTGAVGGMVDGIIIAIVLFDGSLGASTAVFVAGAFLGGVIGWAWRI
jgi:hypothetical protein